MSLLPRRSLDSQQNPYLKFLVRHIRRRPVIFFGVPFFSSTVFRSVSIWYREIRLKLLTCLAYFLNLFLAGSLLVGSVMLSKLTQTRYDYQSTRVQSLTHSDKLRLDQEQQNRKPFDLREEYFKLAQPDQAEPSKFGHVADQDPPSEKVAKKQKRLANWNDWDGNQIRVPRPPGAPEWGGVDPREQSPEIGTRLV